MNQWRPSAGGSEHPVITAPPVTQLAFAAAVVGSELVAGLGATATSDNVATEAATTEPATAES